MAATPPDWPLLPLLIAVEGNAEVGDVQLFAELVANAALPEWRLEVVDDEVASTLGVALWLRAPEANGARLAVDADADDLAATRLVLELAARLSERLPEALAVELNGEEIGSIENGQIDSSLQVGLLDAWSQAIRAWPKRA